MKIYVPTMGRVNSQHAVNAMPSQIRKMTTLVAPKAEVPQLRALFLDVEIVAQPVHVQGIAQLRHWICQTCPDKKVAMLDDDVGSFALRRTDNTALFTPCDAEGRVAVFKAVEKLLDNFAHVGVLAREGGNRITDAVVFNTRMLWLLCYRTDVLKAAKLRYDRVPVMEDFDITLQLLRQGYANAVVSNYVQNQAGSGKVGGCSIYRDHVMQDSSARRLAALHPGFVKVVQKTTKTAWGGGTRTDVAIAWKKAYAEGVAKYGARSV